MPAHPVAQTIRRTISSERVVVSAAFETVKRATLFLQTRPYYRQELFRSGFERLGYQVAPNLLTDPKPGDVLVLWNRMRHEDAHARRYEDAGATVLIAENGYIGADQKGGKLLALARRHHNGAGEWRVGAPERWTMPLKPWRTDGSFILVLPQRGIGAPGVAMPNGWAMATLRMLRARTNREVRLRAHPGGSEEEPYKALEGAWAAVTWGSGAAIKALYAGIPVFYDFPSWIGASAGVCLKKCADLERPFLGDRLPMFQRLSWAQWTSVELQSGEAFAWLLDR